MERYKSIVKSVVISGARHAFLLNDGQTWLSVFLRRDQKPEFQQAIRNIAQGQEYIFDCLRNERNFLNITAIQHPSWPTPIPMRDVQAGAPAQPMASQPMTAPPMPGPVAVPAPPVAQPPAPIASVYVPLPAPVAAPPLPPPQPTPESPAPVTLGPPTPPPMADQPSDREMQPMEIKESTDVSLREQLIARENAATVASNLLCAVIEKGQLPEDVESFITWVGVKFVQLQDLIAANTLRFEDPNIPF